MELHVVTHVCDTDNVIHRIEDLYEIWILEELYRESDPEHDFDNVEQSRTDTTLATDTNVLLK